MNFDGHDLYTINTRWIFDLTTFTCYKTHRDKNGDLTKVDKALKVTKNKNGEIKFHKYEIEIPFGVMRKINKLINEYMEDTYVK